MEEIWKPVFGWEGLYSVSNIGRVKREVRTVAIRKRIHGKLTYYKATLKERVQRINTDSGGYGQVLLQHKESGKRGTFTVHRLVLSSFIRPPTREDHGMHLNDDRLDNRLVNLKWGTRLENSADMVSKGRGKSVQRRKKLTALEIKLIQSKPLEKLRILAYQFGASKSNISKIRAKAKLQNLNENTKLLF